MNELSDVVAAYPTTQDQFVNHYKGVDGFDKWGYLPTPNLKQTIDNSTGIISLSGKLTDVLTNWNDDVAAALNQSYFSNITDANSLKTAIKNGGFGFTDVEKVGFVGLTVNGKDAVSCVVMGKTSENGTSGIYTLKHQNEGNGQSYFTWNANGVTVKCDISGLTF